MKKKVAIVAGGFGRHLAPINDPKWECWGVNATWRDGSEAAFDRWFELHRYHYLKWEHQGDDGIHFRWLKSLRTLPVYVQDLNDWRDVPMARPFPFDEVEGLSRDFGFYHACSIDWMIAYAILLKTPEIGLYGVEQFHTGEPISSRACVEFWSGVAVGKGIKVSSADNTTFKILHYTITRTPYALDPTWLPFEDRTNGHAQHQRERLKATVRTGKVQAGPVG